MKAWLARYNKLWAAAVGIGALFVTRQLDITIFGLEAWVSEAVISAITLLTVERVTNAPNKPDEDHDPEDIRGV